MNKFSIHYCNNIKDVYVGLEGSLITTAFTISATGGTLEVPYIGCLSAVTVSPSVPFTIDENNRKIIFTFQPNLSINSKVFNFQAIWCNTTSQNGIITQSVDEHPKYTIKDNNGNIIALGHCFEETYIYQGEVVESLQETSSSTGDVYTVEIGDCCTEIDCNAFYGFTNLTNLVFSSNSQLETIDVSAFGGCVNLRSVSLPDGLREIGQNAFYNCISISSLTIPSSVTFIDEGAFAYCSSIPSVVIPNDYTTINRLAFFNCLSLTSVTLPNQITVINEGVFAVCQSLSSITIPNSVTIIDDSAFNNCSSLSSVTMPSGLTSIRYRAFSSCKLTSVTIPSSVTSIGEEVFMVNNRLSSVTFEQGSQITTISPSTFNGCGRLRSITIPSGVTSIGNIAFGYCSGLTSITIPSGITTVGESAFTYCSGLTSVTFEEGSRITSIADNTFDNCRKLSSITMPNTLTIIGDNAFNNCSGLTSNAIPSGVTSIGDNGFNNCSSLSSITIPSGVTSIGDNAFNNCSGLSSITIFAPLPSTLGVDIFDNTNDCPIYVYRSYLNDYKTALSEYANRMIGFGVTELIDNNGKSYYFKDCEYYEDEDFWLSDPVIVSANVDKYTSCLKFDGFETMSSVTIPVDYEYDTIGEEAFFYCNNLTGITIPSAITTIDYFAFGYCESFTNIDIPDGVNSIGASAFGACSALTSVVIGSGITSLSSNVFYDCRRLASITIKAIVPPALLGQLIDSHTNCTIYVPSQSVDAYKSASGWSAYSNRIQAIPNS